MSEQRIALLIDCDNVSPASIKGVLAELAIHGRVIVRHAHGNWKNHFLSGWEKKLQPYAIKPIQQFAYTTGKNATDASMIIDAMDLLYSNNVNAFALMTSDSDFTPLVMRILENGLTVYGFGEQKTPQPFVDVCSTFIYTEKLIQEANEDEEVCEKSNNVPVRLATLPVIKNKDELLEDKILIELLTTAVENASNDDGWANMAAVGVYISNNSSFSSVNYGYKKLNELMKETGLFEIKWEETVNFVKIKESGVRQLL